MPTHNRGSLKSLTMWKIVAQPHSDTKMVIGQRGKAKLDLGFLDLSSDGTTDFQDIKTPEHIWSS